MILWKGSRVGCKQFWGRRRHAYHQSCTCGQALGHGRPSQTFRDDERIVAEHFKEFSQYLWLLGVLRHAIHLSL